MTQRRELVEAIFSRDEIKQAREMVNEGDIPFVAALAELTGRDIRSTCSGIAQFLGMRHLETLDLDALTPAYDLLSLEQAIKRNALLLRDENNGLIAAISDPFDPDAVDRLLALTPKPIKFCVALHSDILAFLGKQEEVARTVDQLAPGESGANRKQSSITLSYAAITNEISPAVKLVDSTLYDALRTNASDIHIESTPTGLNVKYRIDGVLDQVTTASGNDLAEQVVSRLKVLAELDISERRIPQDGSLSVSIGEKEIDLRISVMPSIHGEDVVIRILDKRSMVEADGLLSLSSLGFCGDSLQEIRYLTEQAYGMLLVTGPTGSGKTTSLYAALSEINQGKEKIITIEDPVEYQLPGILQIPVNEKKGLTFAKGLRSILRHDPDIIMVGEIRDRDTAEIAVQSALTGHLVFTTVHANNVFDVFGRFTHMGVDLYAFVSSLNGIVAQRLVRMNCPRCAGPYVPDMLELKRAGLSVEKVQQFAFKRGRGCGDCRGTGFKGRKAIAEILILNDELREMIVERKSIRLIKEVAAGYGINSLRDAAIAMVKRGETTLEEIRKVILHV